MHLRTYAFKTRFWMRWFKHDYKNFSKHRRGIQMHFFKQHACWDMHYDMHFFHKDTDTLFSHPNTAIQKKWANHDIIQEIGTKTRLIESKQAQHQRIIFSLDHSSFRTSSCFFAFHTLWAMASVRRRVVKLASNQAFWNSLTSGGTGAHSIIRRSLNSCSGTHRNFR